MSVPAAVPPDTRIEALYPPGPADVPRDLTLPSRAYRLRAWFALAGLAAFFGFYLAISAWFAWIACHLLLQVMRNEGGGLWTVVVALAAAFLSVFMLKALLFLSNKQEAVGTEITEREQPHLFAFLRRLADELGTRQPHKVYLSSRVNAAVIYDLSILNLLIPLRRNLEIGLGLVNVLSLAELKAVLAHEFGHFAQRSMQVGRWVYISQQIASHVVTKRDALDAFLRQLTRIIPVNPLFLLIPATGWIVRLAIWCIRTLTDGTFRLLLAAQRALLRQMEFQADLVAVSVTGSDPLVQALHKTQAADQAWKRAWTFARSELALGRRVPDVFALQSAAIERLRTVLGMPEFGRVPPPPDSGPESYRLFKARFVQPPQMWISHPPSFEREENCKRRYVRSHYDDGSAWALFENADGLRSQITAAGLKSETAVDLSTEASVLALEHSFDRPYLDRRYHGAYLGRSIARTASDLGELYEEAPAENALAGALRSLYPASLGADVELLRTLTEERNSLKAISEGTLLPTNGIIRHRGREILRRDLHSVLMDVQSELDAVQLRTIGHDKRCRSAHLAAAAAVGGGWDSYLRGLAAVLHYAEHSEANIVDARGYLGYVLATVTLHGQISAKEVPFVVSAADDVFRAISQAYEQRGSVQLDPLLLRRLGAVAWPLQSLRFDLPTPGSKNIAGWLKAIDGWVSHFAGLLGQLRFAALDQLLATEAKIAEAYTEHISPAQSPPPSRAPTDFQRRAPGTERDRKLNIDWLDRWQAASNPLAAVSRWLVAASLIVVISWFGLAVGGHGDARKEFQQGLAAEQQARGPEDLARAAEWYRKASEHGLAAAQNNLGVLYSQGRGVPRDPARAATLFRESARQADLEAQLNLGLAYLNGTGVSRDYEQAHDWISRAAQHGLAEAEFRLGLMYAKGLGVAPDAPEAVYWLRGAANQGHAVAEASLGMAYFNGMGVEKDPAQAVVWFRKAAEQGNAMAQAGLGVAYVSGVGVEKDPSQAVAWFHKAAEQGNAIAESNLGIAYFNGSGVDKNPSEAVIWFRKAAEQGLAQAQFNLAIRYYRGEGVAADRKQAISWLEKAAAQRYDPASKALAAVHTQDSLENSIESTPPKLPVQ